MKDKPFLQVVGTEDIETPTPAEEEPELVQHAKMLNNLHEEAGVVASDVTSIVRMDMEGGGSNLFVVSKCNGEELYTMLGVAQSSVLDTIKSAGGISQ